MIEPTVGRILWYYPGYNEILSPENRTKGGYYAAIVTNVHNDNLVDLQVFSPLEVFCRLEVVLVQDNEVADEGAEYCEWMPYQKGQARALEELQKAGSLNENAQPQEKSD